MGPALNMIYVSYDRAPDARGVDGYRQSYDEIMAGVALSKCARGGVA